MRLAPSALCNAVFECYRMHQTAFELESYHTLQTPTFLLHAHRTKGMAVVSGQVNLLSIQRYCSLMTLQLYCFLDIRSIEREEECYYYKTNSFTVMFPIGCLLNILIFLHCLVKNTAQNMFKVSNKQSVI